MTPRRKGGPPPAARIHLTLLGGFEVRVGTGAGVTLPIKKSQALLAFLALPPGRAHSRDKLAALLWGESADAEARGSLRYALTRLRHDLPPDARHALVANAETVALDPALVEVDAIEFGRAVAVGTPEALERAAMLYQGDLLAGISVTEPPFEEWMMAERERLRELAVQARTKQLAHHHTTGQTERAVQTALALLTLDHSQEGVHRALMQLYESQGRRGAALRQYQACVTVLQRELGAEPEVATQRLYRELLQRSAAEPAAPTRPRTEDGSLDARLIGRTAESAALIQTLDETLRGHGQLVLVVGEAGIGKSSLVAALAVEAQRRGARILLGRAHESEQILPLGPWAQAVRAAQVLTDEAVVSRLKPAWRAELARLFPELPDRPSAGEDSLRLFESVVQLGEVLAADGAVVLILEDVHWADEMTLRLAAFFARRLRDRPVAVVLTARDEELGVTTILRRVVDELRREPHLRQLRIGPLSPADTATLVRALARAGTDDTVLARVGDQVWGLSEGNPFVIVETMRALVQGSASAESRPVILPERVQQVITARLDRLSSAARVLLTVAAVIGRDFEFALLARAAGVADGEAAGTLEELVRRGVLHAAGEAFDFTHDRIRDVASAEVLGPRRRLLHRQIAAAIEAIYAANLEPHYAALATHYREGEVWERAHPYLRLAATQAARRAAHAEAVTWFEQALAALRRVQETRETREQAIDLCFGLRGALLPLGRFDEILTCLQDAEAMARALPDEDRHGRALLYMSNYFWTTGHPRDAIRCAESALVVARARNDFALRISSTTFLAGALQLAGDHGRAEEAFRTVIADLESGPTRERFHGMGVSPATTARSYLSWSLAERGVFGEALHVARESVGIARSGQRRFAIIQAEWGLAYVHLVKGDFAEVIPLLEWTLAAAREWNITITVPNQQCLLGTAYVRTGRIEDGLALLREGVPALEAAGLGGWLAFYIVLLGEAWLPAGHAAQARGCGEQALALARARGQRAYEAWALRLLAEATSELDALPAERAQGHYHDAIVLAEELGMRPLVAHCRLGLGQLFSRAGDGPAARRELATAIDLYRTMEMTAALGRAEAVLSRA